MASLAFIQEVADEVLLHSKSQTHNKNSCRPCLQRVRKAFGLFSSLSENEEDALLKLSELFQTALLGQFCVFSISLESDLIWKPFPTLLKIICDPSTSSQCRHSLLKSVFVLGTFLSKEHLDDFVFLCNDLTTLLLLTLKCGTKQQIPVSFASCSKMKSDAFHLDLSSKAKRSSVISGTASIYECFAKIPSIPRGIKAFRSGLEELCLCLETDVQIEEEEENTSAWLRLGVQLSLLPQGSLRIVPSVLQYALRAKTDTWSLAHALDYRDCLFTISQHLDGEILRLCCVPYCIPLMKKLICLDSGVLNSTRILLLELVTKTIPVCPKIVLDLENLEVCSLSSAFYQLDCIECISKLMEVVFRIYPASLSFALDLWKQHQNYEIQPSKKVQRSGVEMKSWIEKILLDSSFEGFLLQTNMISPHTNPSDRNAMFQSCLIKLSQLVDDNKKVYLLSSMLSAFPLESRTNLLLHQTIGEVFSRIQPPTPNLLNLLCKWKNHDASRQNGSPLGQVDLSVIPPHLFVHAEISSTLRFLQKLTQSIFENGDPTSETSSHMKRVIAQVNDTTPLVALLPDWITILFPSQEKNIDMLLNVIDSFALIVWRVHETMFTTIQPSLDCFLKQGLTHPNAYFRSRVARQLGCFVRFASVSKQFFFGMMEFFQTLQSNTSNQRQVYIGIESIGCATKKLDPNQELCVSLLQWSLLKLSQAWQDTHNTVEKVLALEGFRQITKEYDFPDVKKLFDFVGKDLYPALFRALLETTKAPGIKILDRFVLDVFKDLEPNATKRLLIHTFPVVLPFFILNPDYLTTMEKITSIYHGGSEFSTVLLGRLLFTHVKEWIVRYVDCLVEQKPCSDITQLTIARSDFIRGGKKKILEVFALKLQLPNGQENPKARHVFSLLAKECHDPRTCEECAKLVPNTKKKGPLNCHSVEFLIRQEFMFLMNSLSETIHHQKDLLIQKQALGCVSQLLQLLNTLTADEFVPRVLPTLVAAMQQNELQNDSCVCVQQLVKKLTASGLEKNLVGLVLTLLPCSQNPSMQQQALDLIEEILSHKIPPDLLCEVQEMLPFPISTQQNRTIPQRIESLCSLLDRDSDDISLLSLTKLEHLLQHQCDQVSLEISIQNEVISRLFHSLLKIARSVGTRLFQEESITINKIKQVSLKCCECFGWLGAVDPTRLSFPKTMFSTSEKQLQGKEFNNKNLANKLLSDFLIDALNTASDPETHMKVGFVVQEMIRFLEVKNIPEDVFASIRPFLKTNYQLQDNSFGLSSEAKTFFSLDTSFASSLGEWVAYLSSISSNDQRNVFQTLSLLKDANCATRLMLFVLPYVVQNVICLGSKQHQLQLLDEILGVLKQTHIDKVQQLSIQAIFLLLDTLETWVVLSETSKQSESEFPNKSKVIHFLSLIPRLVLAQAAFRMESFPRALFYLEVNVRSRMAKTKGATLLLESEEIELLHKIFAAEQDFDGLKGVIALRTKQHHQPSLLEQILEFESESRWNEAFNCFEQGLLNSSLQDTAMKKKEFLDLHEGQLRCLWRTGNLGTIVAISEGRSTQENEELKSLVAPYALDALWRLGKWSQLKVSLEDYPTSSLFRKGTPCEFTPHLERSRLEILELLSAASMESYERAYPLIVRLQALTELEHGVLGLEQEKMFAFWDKRLNLMSPNSFLRGEVLSIRRFVYQTTTTSNSGGKTSLHLETESWLSLAKTARLFGDASGCESALSMILRNNDLKDDDHMMELKIEAKIQRAKLLNSTGRLYDAFQVLEPLSAELLNFQSSVPSLLGKARAKALLLHTKIVKEIGSFQGQEILDRLNRVLEWNPTWQKGFYEIAKYHDYLLQQLKESDPPEYEKHHLKLLPIVLRAYGKCLKEGKKHYFEVLPRILTLWYSNAEETTKVSPSRSDLVMKDLKENLPIPLWYTVLGQLVSRLCCPNSFMWEITRDILVQVLSEYPTKALWSVFGVYQSKASNRKVRANELFKKFSTLGCNIDASGGGKRMSITTAKRHITTAQDAFTAFINLAQDRSLKVNPTTFFRNTNLFDKSSFGLVLPIQSFLMDATSPSKLFSAVGTVATVMSSKEKPKKIQLIGDDGIARHFLCKHEQKGDLRKDSRLMEFTSVVNALFDRDVQASRRKIRLRTYAVVCLNEDCGLLEWVENTTGFRSQLSDVYEASLSSSFIGVQEGRHRLEDIQHRPDKTSRVVEFQRLLNDFPPVFHKWFLKRFPDASQWLHARNVFTRSCAVWSMLGHIVGLGDRHAENLLLDVTNGEVVHVDFDCLFDKGLTLAKPEIVPFRLTQNMVDGMGLSGVEGTFRTTCEISLDILRKHKTMLLSVLESFVVDPLLVESNRRSSATTNNDSGELRQQQQLSAKEKFSAISERLSGIMRDREIGGIKNRTPKRSQSRAPPQPEVAESTNNAISYETLPLSTPGHVERLIKEATDLDKLSRMFGSSFVFSSFTTNFDFRTVGWCSFL